MLLVAAILPLVGDKVMDTKYTYALISRTCEYFSLGKREESKAVDELRC